MPGILLLLCLVPAAAQTQVIESAGECRDCSHSRAVFFDSLSGTSAEPSPTTRFEVRKIGNANQVIIRDETPGLAGSPNVQHAFLPASGAIHASARLDGLPVQDIEVSGEVNTTGGPDGHGAYSRQGMFVRWDLSTRWYWLGVNFAKEGTAAPRTFILRSDSVGVVEVLPGSELPVSGFDPAKPLYLVARARGAALRLQVYNDDRTAVVADTGEILDPRPLLIRGTAGFMAELAIERPFVPLEASFTNLAAVALR